MENRTNHRLVDMMQYTTLRDRTLWFDGDITVTPDKVIDMLQLGVEPKYIHVNEITKDIQQYNRFRKDKITVKSNGRELNTDWNLELGLVDLETYLVDKIFERHEGQNLEVGQLEERAIRVVSELDLYKDRGLIDILRVIIYIINTLEQNNVVWGVGRGSSVSSYVLYLIGAHDVDSVEYDLDITDFIQ